MNSAKVLAAKSTMPALVQMPWLARQKVLGLRKLDMVLSENEVPLTPLVNHYLPIFSALKRPFGVQTHQNKLLK